MSLEYKNGLLTWDHVAIEEIVNSFETPLHIGCSVEADNAYHKFIDQFLDLDIPLEVHYSVKTNPFPPYLKKLAQLGCKFETVGIWEYDLLKKCGVKDEDIVHTGNTYPFKDQSIPDFRFIAIATKNQLLNIVQSKISRPRNIAITINPGLTQARWDITLNTSRKGNPLGFKYNSEEFHQILSIIQNHPDKVRLMGVQMHLGTNIKSVTPYIKALKILKKSIEKLCSLGYPIETMDIGGGFNLKSTPLMELPMMAKTLLGFRITGRFQNKKEGYLERMAEQISLILEELKSKGINLKSVVAEPGRILSGSSQMIVVTVMDIIKKGKRTYILCDAGAMSLSPMLLTEIHEVRAVRKRGSENDLRSYEILGLLPTSLDRVSVFSLLPKVEVGDKLAVLDTGAYFISMHNSFNGKLPQKIWIEEGAYCEIV